jgi:hypothetical protein
MGVLKDWEEVYFYVTAVCRLGKLNNDIWIFSSVPKQKRSKSQIVKIVLEVLMSWKNTLKFWLSGYKDDNIKC